MQKALQQWARAGQQGRGTRSWTKNGAVTENSASHGLSVLPTSADPSEEPRSHICLHSGVKDTFQRPRQSGHLPR